MPGRKHLTCDAFLPTRIKQKPSGIFLLQASSWFKLTFSGFSPDKSIRPHLMQAKNAI
jgi:hypothetical protein